MRIVFFGTPDFAVAALDILVQNNYDVVGVVTAPDKPAGRGQQLQQSAVKKYALEHQLNVLQPTNLKAPEFTETLKGLHADLQIIVAFRMLPESVWAMPPLGTFNLHASLLPQYRGAAPINYAIINGEKETGVTTFFLQHEIDTGKIIFREKTPIGQNETAGELHDRLMEIGSNLVLKTVRAIESKQCEEVDQASFLREGEPLKTAHKIHKTDCRIDWNKDIDTIHNLIRGLSPYPGAWTELISPEDKHLALKIYKTVKEATEHQLAPGTIVTNGQELKVAVKGGYINVLELQLAGKKRMMTADLLRGFSFDGQKLPV